MVSLNDLNDVLSDQVQEEPSYLIDKNKDESISDDVVEIPDVNEQDNEDDYKETDELPKKTYKCKHDNCDFETDSIPMLMAHAKKEHKKEEKPRDALKRRRKTKEEKMEESLEPPTMLTRLEALLKGYGVKGTQGIIQTASMHDVENPAFIPVLKDLMRNTGTQPGINQTVADSWAMIIGRPTLDTTSDMLKSTSTSKTGSMDMSDPIALLNKIQTGDMIDTMARKAKLAVDEKELDVAKKRKDLKESDQPKEVKAEEYIEHMEPVFGENGKPMLDSQGKPAYRKIRYNMNNLGGMGMGMLPYITAQQQPKNNPDVDTLKKEIDELKKKLLAGPESSEIMIMKQQLTEMQRKHDDEERQRQIKEEIRRDRELYEKKTDELNKRLEEFIRTAAESKKPNTEELLSKQIADMNKQFAEKVAEQQRQFEKTLQERENQTIYSQLKEQITAMDRRMEEQIRDTKEKTDSRVSDIAESMKDFANDMTHTLELHTKDREKKEEVESLKKKIEDVQKMSNMSKEQLLTTKGMEMAETAIKGGGEALSSFGKLLGQSSQKAAETMSAYDRSRLALELVQSGKFSPEQAALIVAGGNSTVSIPKVPSAEQTAMQMKNDYKNLNQISDVLATTNKPPDIGIQQPQQEQSQQQTEPELPEQPIKFLSEEHE